MRHAEWNDIGANAAKTDDHCTFANTDKLANRHATPKNNMITNCHVAAEDRVVSKNNVVADLAIMSDMRAHHEETPVANFRNTTIIFGARAHCYVFTDVAFGTHNQPRRPSSICKRLRRRPERRKRVNDRSRPYGGVTGQIDVSNQAAAVGNSHVCADRAVWTDQNVFSDRGSGFDPRRGIDHMRAHASDSMAPTWASATISPATFASPRYHHIDLRRVMRSI